MVGVGDGLVLCADRNCGIQISRLIGIPEAEIGVGGAPLGWRLLDFVTAFLNLRCSRMPGERPNSISITGYQPDSKCVSVRISSCPRQGEAAYVPKVRLCWIQIWRGFEEK